MLKKIQFDFLPFLGGILYAAGFPLFSDFSIFIGPLLGFLLLNISLTKNLSIKDSLKKAWFFSIGFLVLGFYWIPFTLKEFGGLFFPFNYILGFVFSIGILPQTYFYVLAQRKVKSPFVLAFCYALLEYFIPQQFPAHLGHAFLYFTPKFNLFLAPIFGNMAYSFITAFIALIIIKQISEKKLNMPYHFIALIFIIISLLPSGNKIAKNTKEITVRVVQPNIGNYLKIESEKGNIHSIKNVFALYYNLSTAKLNNPVDLIIWPETAYPDLINSSFLLNGQKAFEQTPPLIEKILSDTKSDLFVGGYDYNPVSASKYGFESDFNSAFHFGSQDKNLLNVYHKMKLIPFGEGLPFGPFNQFLSKYITNISFFAHGEKPALFKLKNDVKFTSAICYEILFPNLIRNLLNNLNERPHFLINLTNDSWYGDTSEPYQHLFLAKWRALEFNLPIIRSTNTGISSIIFPDGSESERMLIDERGFKDYKFIASQNEATPFQRNGVWPFIFIMLIFIWLEKILLLKDHANE
jgi:apolipoprotein N-acyltransferase